jgi:hypothetical protein
MRELLSNSPLSMFKRPVASKYSIALRMLFLSCFLLASMAGVFAMLFHARSAAHADPTLIQANTPVINSNFPAIDPWALTFDNSGKNIWVAEPQCDVNVSGAQVCSHTFNSGFLEYRASGFNSGSTPTLLYEPSGYSSPFFVKFDSAGNMWFTEPNTDSIGEYDTSGSWHQWTVPTAAANPFDLTIDLVHDTIWFTELSVSASKIGEFIPSTATFNEYPTPTSGSQPYGITGPDPATNSIWFTENSQYVHRIGRLMLKADGTPNGAVQEYLTNSSSANGITPHLITYDTTGDIWWSEGYDGQIGELVISKAANGTSNGVTEYTVPAPDCPNPPPQGVDCGTHISGIAVDSNGVVWFDDARSSRYGSFNPSASAGQQFNIYIIGGCVANNTHPHDGLIVDGSNNVWFTEEFGDTLNEAVAGSSTNPTPCPTPSPSPTSSPSPSPPPQGTPPVSKQWYFAEGRAGKGFTEYLTTGNPTSSFCQVDIEYLYTPDGGASQTKTIVATISPNTRHTDNVDQDLGTSSSGTGIDVSTIVTVDTTATPNCPGVVAERPMYFTNTLGVSSGHDALGATHLGTNFYFADVSSLPGYRSFITILNPPGGSTANVVVTYYLNGSVQGTDALAVPVGTRGTITPRNFGARVAAWVTSSQPVAVERPTYFSNYKGGNAATVAGAAVTVGAPALSNDWLFAEGYTGGQFQEYFAIANIDTSANAPATVTVTLEFSDTTTKQVSFLVNPLNLYLWNVNSVAPNQNISAEITSTGAKIVVEREMFFRYTHVANGRSLTAMGGTDVMGQPGPAAAAAYSFAEGYVNTGYDEWLTVQNPTNAAETLTVTLVNGSGKSYAFTMQVGLHSRATADIVHIAQQNMCSPGAPAPCWEISMSMQAGGAVFVAERPMYFYASGSQGGTDVLGYTGN